MSGTLHVVATPIGNLEDLTRRAERVLGESSLVACEDTRHTSKLLRHLGLRPQTLSYHEHNEEQRIPEILEELRGGRDVALVTDAGTPGLSDPGYRLVRAAREAGLRVEAVPGPAAAVAALSISGLPTDAFVFLGFLPSRKKARREALEELAPETRTVVLYEAPHRIVKSLADMAEILGEDRPAFLAREMTKVHEEHLLGTLDELHAELSSRERVKGEITLVVGGASGESSPPTRTNPSVLATEVTRLEGQGMPRKEAIKEVARRHELPKSVVWNAVHRGA